MLLQEAEYCLIIQVEKERDCRINSIYIYSIGGQGNIPVCGRVKNKTFLPSQIAGVLPVVLFRAGLRYGWPGTLSL
jgi:hypothetical protein